MLNLNQQSKIYWSYVHQHYVHFAISLCRTYILSTLYIMDYMDCVPFNISEIKWSEQTLCHGFTVFELIVFLFILRIHSCRLLSLSALLSSCFLSTGIIKNLLSGFFMLLLLQPTTIQSHTIFNTDSWKITWIFQLIPRSNSLLCTVCGSRDPT